MQNPGNKESLIRFIEQKAREIRIDIVKMTAKAGSGHPGGSLSAADIVATLYFGEVLRVKPDEPDWPDRDRFVLSKGHAAPVLYSALAGRGFFPADWLDTLRQLGSPLQGHPDCKKVPGVEVSTGSLGQGLSMAVGMALAGRLDQKDYNVWVLLGDGECQEGQIWEAAMAASHYKLDNLIAIVDHNGLQIDGRVRDVMSIDPIDDKFRAFGWHVFRVDGHRVDILLDVFQQALDIKGKPAVVVADTVKGKGVSFMEGEKDWHGKAPNPGQLEEALKQLQAV
ncbi:MAG: transketolase [Bacillota bacterium]|jgi:transketolase|nr:transketolase [Candidatus Fermentithermobacillaceae bacterium]